MSMSPLQIDIASERLTDLAREAFGLEGYITFVAGDYCDPADYQRFREYCTRLRKIIDEVEAVLPPAPVLALPAPKRRRVRRVA